MAEEKKYNISRLVKAIVALALASGVLIITASAIGNRKKESVQNVQITINSPRDMLFVSSDEIVKALEKAAGKTLKNQPIGSLNLTAMEKHLLKNNWIKKAELFIDNSNTLRVTIEESIPVARVFTSGGSSFYVSSTSDVLPLSDRFSARVPVFTNFSGVPGKFEKNDSALISEIHDLSDFISKNPFWMSQIDQVVITPASKFEMVPKLGNQLIRFGGSDDCEEKFRKLLAFYKQVQMNTGWNRYSIIDLQFKGQVVATKRDAASFKADSLASIRIMKNIIEEAGKKVNDSTLIQMPSKEASENAVIIEKPTINENDETPELKPGKIPVQPISDNPPVLKKTNHEKSTEKAEQEKVIIKPKKDTIPKRVPKALMPPKNEDQ